MYRGRRAITCAVAKALDRFGDSGGGDLNRIKNPDRIHPGQLIRLPAEANDQGVRAHADGRLVARPGGPTTRRPAEPGPARPTPDAPAPSAQPETPQPATPAQPGSGTLGGGTGRQTDGDGR